MSRARAPLLLARAFVFFFVTFMVTWDKTLLFTPLLVNSNHYFCNIFAWLHPGARIPTVMCWLRAATCHLSFMVFP